MRSPRLSGGPADFGGSPGSDLRSPPSASKRQRTSLSCGAGGTEIVRTPAVTTLDAEEDDAVDAGAPFDDAEEEDDGAGAAYGDGAEAQEGAQEDAAALGGEASPVPFDAAMALLRRRLLRGEGDVELTPSLQKNYNLLMEMFGDTLKGSHNNSMLLLGPRGVGKSLVLRRALAALSATHGDTLVAVRLSGLLHSDERTALRELARQLGAPAAAEEEEAEAGEGAGEGDAGGAAARAAGSVRDNMALLQSHLRSLEQAGRCALFVLEEFDLFAAATQRKQMLLYNLMDAMQASTVRAAVVGVSVRTDAAELLEKRVRSRFSHRRLVFEPQGEGPLLRSLLRLPPAFPHAPFAARWNDGLDAALADAITARQLADAAGWDRAPRAAAGAAMLALASLPRGAPSLTPDALKLGAAALHRDALAAQLAGATVCELHLLVACKRLQRLRERPAFNFAAVYEEYAVAAACLGAPAFPRDVALRAFEALAALGVLEPADAGAGRAGGWLKEYAQYTLLLADAEAEAALRQHPQAPTGLVDLLRHEATGASAGGTLA